MSIAAQAMAVGHHGGEDGSWNPAPSRRYDTMGDQKVAGTMSDIEGKVKEGVGKLTDDERLEAEGKAKQVQGDLQRGLGEAQDQAKDTWDQSKDKVDRAAEELRR
jgi:uncharacterized protein YjbJ (UPF0337 family)